MLPVCSRAPLVAHLAFLATAADEVQDANSFREAKQPLERGVSLEMMGVVAEALKPLPTNDLDTQNLQEAVSDGKRLLIFKVP